SDIRTETASIVDRIRPVLLDGTVVAAFFLGDSPIFVLSEETLAFAPAGQEPRRVSVHGGAILAAAADDGRIIPGGDDGKVVATDAAGSTTVVATDTKRRWIDRVATGADGAVGWSSGKQAFVRTRKGEERVCEAPSSVGGLAFAPKGFRLAI